MRNLKRVLSLALALVMVLGMMVITSSAAAFTDAEEITYQEAVEVMSALGVIDGVEAADGTFAFNPTETLTREQGAKIICYMLMGKSAAEKLVGSGKFDDVKATRWSAGSIDYCATLGILAGVGDNKFDPTGELTAVQFGKMLLCAMGYDAKAEGYEGKDWATNIAVDMVENGLDVDGVAMDAQLTREQAAQMAFQSLFVSEAVEKVTLYTINVTTDAGNGMDAVDGTTYATFTEAYLIAKEAQGTGDVWTITTSTQTIYTDSLADKLFGLSYGSDSDNFERPATAYASTMPAYKAVNYVLIVDGADYTIEGSIPSKLLYNKVGYKAAAYTWVNYVDGVYDSATKPSNTSMAPFTGTADGTVMYIYVDGVNQIVTTNLINTHIGEVKKVTEAKDGVPRYVTLTNGKTFVTEEFAAKDIVLYTESGKMVGSTPAPAGIQSMELAEIVSGKLEKITSDGTYTVDGTDYVVAVKGSTAIGAGNLGKTVSFYVDGFGNIMMDKGAAAASAQYIYVLANSAVVSTTSYQTGITKSLEVYGVDTAGNVVTYTVSKIDSAAVAAQTENTLAGLYSYVVNPLNGTYELTNVTTAATVAADIAVNDTTLTHGTPSATAIMNSDTVFVFVKQAKKGQGDLTVTEVTVKTGNASVGSAINAYNSGSETDVTPAYVVADKGVAKVVFVDRGFAQDATATTNVTYIQHNVRYTTETVSTAAGSVTTHIYANTWNVDGQQTVTNKTAVAATGLYKMNDDGSVGALVSTTSGVITAINGNVITIDGTYHLNVTDKTIEIFTGDDVDLLVGQSIAYAANSIVTTNLDYVVVTADQATVAYSVTGAETTTYELIKGTGVVNTVKLTVDVSAATAGQTVSFGTASETKTLTADDIAAGSVTVTVTYTAPTVDVAETVTIA